MRIIHVGKLYQMEYPKIALQIANNVIQNDYIRQAYRARKERQTGVPYERSFLSMKPASPATLNFKSKRESQINNTQRQPPETLLRAHEGFLE